MMDAGMMSYDSRSVTTPPLQRPVMAPQYFTSTPYSAAPMTSMAAPQYQPQMPFSGYGSYNSSPTAVVPPFKHQYQERSQMRAIPEHGRARTPAYSKDSRSSYVDGSRSPSLKSETQGSSTKSVSSNPSLTSRTITSNVCVNGATQIAFHTSIDNLMKAIQSKDDTDTIVKKAEADHVSVHYEAKSPEQTQQPPQQQPQQQPQPPRVGKPTRKRYKCNIEGCSKAFFQKTHLDIHIRAHTGEQPYVCKLPNCGQRFSQLGNLKTHERRHTGERPYSCDQCGKRFAQRGNVRAHLKTHESTRPFVCRLDSCNKTFTQLGNLKSHQNKFHVETVKNLTSKFATLKNYDNITKDERELLEYFATLYKNSNKGIKGRGKDRKVGAVTHASPTTPSNTIPSQFAVQQHQALSHLPHAAHAMQRPLPQHGLSHPAAYSMSRPNLMVHVPNRDGHGYDMFEVEDDGVGPSGATSTASGTIYDDEHGRGDLAFADRLTY